ncbi:Uncharacterised protein [Campylobacter insulaenigrae]|nr:Uncharacterised protein [Campylobacter insulaenigrae]
MNKLANYFINTNIDKFVLRFVVILVFLLLVFLNGLILK